MGKGSPPQAPDPAATAAAQANANKAAAIATYGVGATNQVTPYGNLTYTQGDNWSDGTPHFTATQTLSPEQQQLYNLGTTTQKTLGQIGVDQSGKVANILNTPFDLNSAIGTSQSDMAHKLLDPVWQQRESALGTKLANQGITQGSQAYTNALRDFGMQRDNAYNSSDLATRGEASTEALANRNQPLNEISALMSGSQVQQPNFINTPNPTVAAPNYEGDVAQNYAGQMAGYNAQLANNAAMMGGIAGIASAPLGGWARNGFKFG